jgi:anti-sigma regulatory factor (Ser/Thr protein kinase)
MVADATGHGLPAAISTLPAARDFFTLAQKGLPLGEIVTELNSVMAKFLPVGMMLAANIFEIKASGLELAFWGGGLPDSYVLNTDGSVDRKLTSNHMPLGVLDNKSFEANIEILQLTENQKLCCFTDGVIEAKDPQGEQYGYARLEQVLSQTPVTISKIYDSVHNHSQSPVDDDLSILILDFPLLSSVEQETVEAELEYSQLPTQLSVCFNAQLLREITVMNEVRGVLQGLIGGTHLDLICTALSELFSNAIDHGLLELDSELKQQDDGFFLYYQQYQKRLSQLDNEKWITLKVSFRPQQKEVELQIEHNGKGFEHSQILSDVEADDTFGRGISIVQGLCHSVEYTKEGRCATAVYSFHSE